VCICATCCMPLGMHVHARSLIIRQHDMALEHCAHTWHIVLSLRINLCICHKRIVTCGSSRHADATAAPLLVVIIIIVAAAVVVIVYCLLPSAVDVTLGVLLTLRTSKEHRQLHVSTAKASLLTTSLLLSPHTYM